MKRLAGILALLTALAAGDALAASKAEKALTAFRALTPEHFKSTVTFEDSGLDVHAKFNTQEGFQEKRGLLKLVWDDVFLRAFVDKKTGATAVQVYAWVVYDGEWRFYNSANYAAFGEPQQVDLNVLDRKVLSCSSSGCSHREQFGFLIEEAYLRKMVASNNPQDTKIWLMRFNAKDGTQWNTGISGNEIAGLLLAVDEYRAQHNLPAWKPEAAETN